MGFFLVVCRLLIAAASLAAEHKLQGTQDPVMGSVVAVPGLGSTGFIALRHMGSS